MRKEDIEGNAAGKGNSSEPQSDHPARPVGPLRDRLEREAKNQPPRSSLVNLSEIIPDGLPSTGALYTPSERELLERCLGIVGEQGVTGASVLARSYREAADRHKERAISADAERASLEATRLEIESLPEGTDLNAPVGHLRERISSGPFAGQRERSWTDRWRETCNAWEFERNVARRAWEEADRQFVLSELLLAAIDIYAERALGADPNIASRPGLPPADDPSLQVDVVIHPPVPGIVTHYVRTGKPVRPQAVWQPLAEWIRWGLAKLGPEVTSPTKRAKVIADRMRALMDMSSKDAGDEAWVGKYLRKKGVDPSRFKRQTLDKIEELYDRRDGRMVAREEAPS